MSDADWLPNLLEFADGDWEAYIERVYARYCADFEGVSLEFLGIRVSLKRHPAVRGRSATFHHLTSEGPIEEDRDPDLKRCERIAWVRAMFDAAGTDRVRLWRNQRQTKRGLEENVLIALPDFSFVVVLRDREEYMMLWTAYPVKNPERLRREYVAAVKIP